MQLQWCLKVDQSKNNHGPVVYYWQYHVQLGSSLNEGFFYSEEVILPCLCFVPSTWPDGHNKGTVVNQRFWTSFTSIFNFI